MLVRKTPKELYVEELNDVRWLTKRQSILARDMHLCTECHTNVNLQVHHIYYVYGNHAWDYPNKALITLCDKCHKRWHRTHELEFRDKVWAKNEEYVAAIKGSRVKKVKPTIKQAKSRKKKNKGLKIPRHKLKHARSLY